MIRLIDERIMEKLRDSPKNLDYSELVSLVGEWREEGAMMAKCPHCIEPIQKQATKCNRCFSTIEWFKFDGLYGPCKPGEYDDVRNALLLAKEQCQAEARVALEASLSKLDKRIQRITSLRCHDCGEYLVDRTKVRFSCEEDVKLAEKKLVTLLSSNQHYVCSRCDEARERKGRFILIAVLLVTLAWVIWAGSSK